MNQNKPLCLWCKKSQELVKNGRICQQCYQENKQRVEKEMEFNRILKNHGWEQVKVEVGEKYSWTWKKVKNSCCCR